MNIGHLLEAVEISDFVPSAYPEVYKLGWEFARFGHELVGLTDNPRALGRELRRQTDFFRCPSGLLDSHHVIFNFEDIVASHPSKETAIRLHLEWMVDCRRNPDVISSILELLPDCTDLAFRGKIGSKPKRPNLHALARNLANLWAVPIHRTFVEALVEGNLFKVRGELSDANALDKVTSNSVREMYVLWCLFDMQVMASRLYHAEKNADEAGSDDDPSLMTVRSLRAFINEFIKSARKFDDAFKAGRTEAQLNKKLRDFIVEHGLEDHARRNAEKMGLTPEQVDGGAMDSATRRKLIRFLNEVRTRAEHLQGSLDTAARGNSTLVKRTDFAPKKGSTRREVRADGPQFVPSKLTLEMNSTASTIRFSMPVLSALAYSIQRVCQAMATIPRDASIGCFKGEVHGEGLLKSAEAVRELRDGLLEVYRTQFTRDRYLEAAKSKKGSDFGYDATFGSKSPKPRFVPGAKSPANASRVADRLSEGGGRISSALNAEINVLEQLRASDHQEPEDEYIDWMFESSLHQRLNGPIQSRSKVREIARVQWENAG